VETCPRCRTIYRVEHLTPAAEWNAFGHRYCPFCGLLSDEQIEEEAMEETTKAVTKAVDEPKKLAANPPTVLVEVLGGMVHNVCTEDLLPCTLRVVVRDYDNLKVDPRAEDEEWMLGPGGERPC